MTSQLHKFSRHLLLGILMLAGITLFSQNWINDLVEEGKPLNFYEIQKKANEYWTTHDPTEKGKGFKPYKRWENYWENRLMEDGTFPPAGITNRNFQKYLKSHPLKQAEKALAGANWTSIGPNSTDGGYAGIGRINAIAFHPTNNNIIYLGSPGGGFWKTTNGGVNWTCTTDNLSSLGVSAIVVKPSNPNEIFLATGDGDATDTWSFGVLKSTDGGNNWAITGLDWSNSYNKVIREMIMDPNDENTMMLASNDGIYRTTDGAVTWAKVQSGNFYDIEANPNAATNTFYACTQTGFHKSTDNGATWTNVQNITGSNRIELAVAPSNSNVVYALTSLSSNSGFKGLYRSDDSGSTYVLKSSSPNLLGWADDGSDSGGQGWYDLTLGVNPTDENTIFTGGVTNWKSTDGGVTWALNSFWYGIPGVAEVHADKHHAVWRGSDFFQGNDGGIYRTTDNGTTWVDISGDLVISQMYRLGVSQSDAKAIAGLQDNGTKLMQTNGAWSDVIGGDGMECAIHPTNSQVMYGEVYYGNIERSTNGGVSWTSIKPSGSGNGQWITPFTLDPTTPTTIYMGFAQIYKSTNQGNSWSTISPNFGLGAMSMINVAPSNSNYIYTGTSGALRRTTDGGATWSNVTVPGSGTVMLAIHPLDPNTLYAVRSNYTAGAKVYKSTDGAATWTNISGSLPNLPANCIVYANCTQDGLYVGMDAGVYYKDNTMADWILHNDNLPNAEIRELEIDYNEKKIYAATYGRGMWKADLFMSAPLITITAGTTTGPTTCGGSDGSIVLNFTNVPNGSYLISYKRNGTSASQTVTVTSNSASLTGLNAGNYTEFSITAVGCVGTLAGPVVLNDPALPVVDPVASQSVCAGAPVAAVNFSGTAGATFNWTNDNVNIGLAASGSGNITGYTAPGVLTTQTGNIVVTPVKAGCVGNPTSFTITIKALPVISVNSQVDPTCGNFDGSISFGFTNVPDGNYILSYTRNSIPQTSTITVLGGLATLTGLGDGMYAGFSITANSCTGTSTTTVTLSCGTAPTCPSIGTLNSGVSVSCKSTNFTLTANGLANMGSTYGISFISSTTPLADPYTGGTLLGTVPNSGLLGGGTQAVLNTSINTAASYYIYAIISPLPSDPGCRPSKNNTIKILDCTPVITSPCSCKNNATTLTNGQFDETITVNAPAGQTWTVTAVSGLYQTSSPAPPGTPVVIPIGYTLTPGAVLGDGSTNYTLLGIHVDAVGYSVTVSNGTANGSVGATCYYPNPQINALAPAYCQNEPSVTLSGSATLGGPPGGAAIGTGTFTVNGTPATVFDPSVVGAGTHTVVYTFDAADGVPNASHPGCIQSVSQSVVVNPVPTANAVASATYCPGASVPASNFSGTPSGVTFSWTRTAGAIGLAPLSGNGNVPSFVATNGGATPISSTFTVTPSYTNAGKTCTGTPVNYTITINPTPTVNAQTNKTYCSSTSTGGITFTGNATKYNWTNTNTAIGLASSGTATPSIPSWVPVNNGGAPVTGTITVTPVYTNNGVDCFGSPITFTITIIPTPNVNAQTNKTYCSGTPTGGITFTGTATAYNWTNTNTAIGLAANGTASPTIPSWIPVNNTNFPISGTITVTPEYTLNGVTCSGAPISFTITVNPGAKAVCKDFTLYLNNTGTATLTPANIDGGSTGGTLSISKTGFNCADVGNNAVILTVTDICNGTSTCAAIVKVVDNIAPVINGVPADLTIECDGTIPAVPTVTATDNCSAILTFAETNNKTSHTTLCSSISYDIKRIWTAVDPSGNKTVKTQVIKLVDTKAPTFTLVPPAFLTVECDDDADNNIDPIAVDGCDSQPTMLLDIKYNFNPNGCKNSYVATYLWTAGDKCGNTAQYIQQITVEDQEPPVIVCPPNIVLVSQTPVSASWILPKSYDYCDGILQVKQIAGPPSGSLFTPGTITTIVYQATDLCGNVSTCSFTVGVKFGGSKIGFDVSGKVLSALNPAKNIHAEAVLSGGMNQFTETNNGSYLFSAIPEGTNLTVSAKQEKYPLNGVNALDLVYITNHVLGKKPLDSPIKLLAADVNKSKTVTTADIAEIRKLILHITDKFPVSKSWEFLPQNTVFSNPYNPWLEPLVYEYNFTNIKSDKTADFIGYKMGDVTNDANPDLLIGATETRTGQQYQLSTAAQDYKKGETVEMRVQANKSESLKAMQFTMEYDVNALEFVGIEGDVPGIGEGNFGLRYLENGQITGCIEMKEQYEGSSLFTVKFAAKADGKLQNDVRLSSARTPSLAFDESDVSMGLNLTFTGGAEPEKGREVILYQNEPNPYTGSTLIRFSLPSEAEAVLSIYNAAGTLLKEVRGTYHAGENGVEILSTDLPSQGIYFYQLTTGTYSGMKKMVFLK
ncbi:MAG TPA: T9SS type A sorting domain-containing protein [Saprospiraceae bacterium]|nr:T9SS type A sorting domain-containing protein [Saprospiraceae bacterium]HNL28963.1 T9SS type A sorting domain-containing protein [Saprospiraceae bacterium]